MYAGRALSFVVRGKRLLNEVDLRLARGKVVVVVGPNGAGKSTLLKIMAGEVKPSAGEVSLNDRPLREWPASSLARHRAVLPQAAEVVFPFLVSEVISIGLRPQLAGSTDALIRRSLAAVELEDFADRHYGTLSGGEKQRVQLARVLAQVWSGEGGYLLLDEPTTSLDLSHQLLILHLARAHAAAGGSVMMILHDLNLAAMVADEIVALKHGCRVAAGPPDEVITNDLVAALYGVHAEVRGVPKGPFILPQTARLPG